MPAETTPAFLLLKNIRLIIFDLDGTLYDQSKLRRRLSVLLLLRMITLRIRLSELRIIASFRRQREEHKGFGAAGLEELQYQWSAQELKLPVAKVRSILEKYMYSEPLPYLKKAIYPGVEELFRLLRTNKIIIAVYSDFPVDEKLEALGLKADLGICSTEPGIDQLKPGTKAIEKIAGITGCNPGEMVLIGDRDDTDGESARMAGIRFIKLEPEKARKGIFFSELINAVNSHHE